MAPKKRQPAPKPKTEETSPTLKDRLSPDIVHKLKAQLDDMKAEEAKAREEQRQRAEEARKAEQKRLENDFGHLLANDKSDWRKFK